LRTTKNKDVLVTQSNALSEYSFQGSRYSCQERIRAVAAYLIHGTINKVSETTGIPKTTLRDWRNQEWWGPLADEVRAEKEIEFQAGFSRIVESAIGEIEDRLEHGDVKLVKTKNGYEQQRVPVSAKDATMVAAIGYDKLRLSLNLPTSIRATSDNSLEALAEKFKKIAKEYRREVIDVTPPEGE
jgi:transposase-like protein